MAKSTNKELADATKAHVTLDTAASLVARSFSRALRLGYRPSSFGVLGQPGVGKTASLAGMARAQGWRHVSIPMGNKEPPDLQGLMSLDETDPRYFIYRVPEWARGLLKGECEQPTLVVLDDFPHSTKQVQAGALKLIHEGQFGDNTPVDNQVMFVLTGNRLEDSAGAAQMLSPVRSRVRWFQVQASVEEWLARCSEWDTHFKVRAWLSRQTQYFCAYDAAQFVYPCPRSHEALSRAQHESDDAGVGLTHAEAEGIVGAEPAAQYLQFCRAEADMTDPKDVLRNPTKCEVNSTNLDAFVMLVKALEYLSEQRPSEVWEPVVEFTIRKDLGKGDLMASLGNAAIMAALNEGKVSAVEVGRSKLYGAFLKRFLATSNVSSLAKRLGASGE